MNVSLVVWACYTPLFIAGCMIHIHKQLSRAGRVWSQAVRDREFLVELKLKNLEPEDIAVAKAKKAACRKREMEGGDTDSDVSEDEGDEEVEEEEGR